MGPRQLRAELLTVYGIGPETADDIVLYAVGLPSFVIDAYTRRIIDRMLPRRRLRGYAAYQPCSRTHLPHDAPLFNEYHALLDAHAKAVCLKRQPRCASCVLADLCARRAGALIHRAARPRQARDERIWNEGSTRRGARLPNKPGERPVRIRNGRAGSRHAIR